MGGQGLGALLGAVSAQPPASTAAVAAAVATGAEAEKQVADLLGIACTSAAAAGAKTEAKEAGADQEVLEGAMDCLWVAVELQPQAAVEQLLGSGGTRVLLDLVRSFFPSANSISRRALLVLCQLQQDPRGRNELIKSGGLSELAEGLAAEPEHVMQALSSLAQDKDPALRTALVQCQPALRALVRMLTSNQRGVGSSALQSLETLTGSFKVCLRSQPAPQLSANSQLAEMAAPLLEAGIIQQLNALLSGSTTMQQNLEPLQQQAFGLAAALALSSETAAQAILQEQEQEQQQQQQQQQQKQKVAPGCCGIISTALALLGDHPLAMQLLLQLLQCRDKYQRREAAALVREVAGDLFAEQFYFARESRGVLEGVVLALRLLPPDQAWDVLAEDFGFWIRKLAYCCSASCQDQPHMCDLVGLALVLAKQNSTCSDVLTEAQTELLQHVLPLLTSALQSANSSNSSRGGNSRGGCTDGDRPSTLDVLLPPCFDALELAAKAGAAQLHRDALCLGREMLSATTTANSKQQQQQQQRMAQTINLVCMLLQQHLNNSGPCHQVSTKFDPEDELIVDCYKRLHAAVLGLQEEGVANYAAAMRAVALTMAALADQFAQVIVAVRSQAASASDQEQKETNRIKHLKDKLVNSQQHNEKLQRELRAFRKEAAKAGTRGAADADAGSDTEEFLTQRDREARKDRFRGYKNTKKSAGPYPAH